MLNTIQNRPKQRLKKPFFILLGLYVMIGTALYLLQEKILFQPTVLAQDYKFDFSHKFEELFLNTEDNAVINAIHFKVLNPKGVILYFHGNVGDLQRWGKITEFFADKQYNVFVMDYRTYGKSMGTLSEQALYNDAEMCYNFLLKHYKEEQITIYGRSLGTGIATYLASKKKPKLLILETPYYSILDVAKNRFPIFPVKQVLKYKFPTHQFIKNVDCKISMFHGTNDGVVPFKSGKKLFNLLAKKNNSCFTAIENGNHNNLIDFQKYLDKINTILP